MQVEKMEAREKKRRQTQQKNRKKEQAKISERKINAVTHTQYRFSAANGVFSQKWSEKRHKLHSAAEQLALQKVW